MTNDFGLCHIGLCATCRHATVVQSDRGAKYYLCQLGLTDPAFPKYPRLPVFACRGYEPPVIQSS